MKRVLELALVVMVVAVLGWLARPQAPQPAPQVSSSLSPPVVYEPGGPPLTFNGLKPGDRLADVEARLGPPDFRNPNAHFQQWERPLTQVTYDERGVIIEVGGSGRGILRQGDRDLLRCGDEESAVTRAFGVSRPEKLLYRFPIPPFPEADSWLAFVEVFCGSESQGKRWVSHLQLTIKPPLPPPASAFPPQAGPPGGQ